MAYETPNIIFADPVDPKPYLEAGDSVRRRILRMCGQGHLGGISNAEASGIAYEQARAVFEKDLDRRRVPEEGMLRELLTSVLALAEWIAGSIGKYTSVMRVTVDQHINPGPRSPDLVRLDLESYEHGLLSDETAMSRLGVEDLQAEKIRIRKSAVHILDVLEKAGALVTAWTPESIKAVLLQLEIPEPVVNVLVPKPEPEPEPVPPQA